MTTTNHTSPIGEDAANGAMGEREAFFDVVFDGPPSHDSGRFVEVEDEQGRSFNAGEWIDRGNGLWALRINRATLPAEKVAQAGPEWIAKLRQELMLSKMTHNFTFSRDEVIALLAAPQPAQTQVALTDEQIEALVIEHSEWTPQGMAIVDSHRRAFARALLTAAHHETRESGENS